MKQGGKHSSLGFTIVETLIVLAVTSALFVSVAALISGKQNKTEFMTAINSVTQQIQQIINETGSGYYPSSVHFQCVTGGGQPTVTSLAGTGQGTNNGCIFIGKIIEFGVPTTNPQQFVTIPIAGNKAGTQIKGNGVCASATSAQPVALTPGNGAYAGVPDFSTGQTLEGGLTVGSMTYNGSTKTAGVGFLSGDNTTCGVFATNASSGLGYNSGSQQLSLYAVATTHVDAPSPTQQTDMANAIDVPTNGANLVQASNVNICFVSGSTQQLGIVTIGGNGGLGVTLAIKDGTVCP